ANTLAVADAARAMAEEVRPTLPEGMTIVVGSDDSQFISRAIEGVWKTLAEAAILVVLVIYLFLGSWRATLIPAVTVPLCLLASFAVLWLFGFSINLLTLLAMVLCIDIVVDDAIVVLENVYHRIEEGDPPLRAACYSVSRSTCCSCARLCYALASSAAMRSSCSKMSVTGARKAICPCGPLSKARARSLSPSCRPPWWSARCSCRSCSSPAAPG